MIALWVLLAGCLPASLPVPEVVDDPGHDWDGDGFTEADGDCDDADAEAHPEVAWREDGDGDGYGAGPGVVGCRSPGDGYVARDGDCDDGDATLHPETVWFVDGDGDGWGDAASPVVGCDPGAGHAREAGDCDDADAERSPDTVWHVDADGDGFGTDATFQACEGDGGAATAGDCDDGDDAIWPGAPERYDGEDADCDGEDVPCGTYAWQVPGDVDGIQEAIDLACAGDVVEVGEGTWDEALAIDRAVTIRGAGTVLERAVGPIATISADGARVEGVTFRGAVSAGDGGAVRVEAGARAELADVAFDDNHAGGAGGALYVAGRATLAGASFTGGDAADGGAIAVVGGELDVADVTIDGSTAGDAGGAVYCVGGLSGEGLTVTGAIAARGGALAAFEGCAGTLTDVWLLGNEATDAGGGAFYERAELALVRAEVRDNVADVGGGVAFRGTSFVGGFTTQLQAAVIAGNRARDGGGVYVSSDAASGINVTVAGNVATGAGGGMWLSNSLNSWTNLIVAGNEAPDGQVGGIHVANYLATPTLTYVDLWGNEPVDYTASQWSSPPTGASGHQSADPRFVSFAPALDPLGWDLHLAAASPAIDAGTPAESDGDGTIADLGGYGGSSADASYWADADADGMYDGWEARFGLDDASGDPDADGSVNLAEFLAGTDPTAADTDGDGKKDGADADPLDPTP